MASNNAFMRGEVDGFSNVAGLPTQRKNVIPRFFVHPVKVKDPNDKTKFVFQDVEMVELLIAGDAKSAPVEKVTDRHRQIYSEQYEAFTQGQQLSASGTPLEMWPVMVSRPALIQALKFSHVYTVEALAGIPDNAVQKLGPGVMELRALAQTFVEAKEKSDPQERLARENKELRDKLELLEKRMNEITTLKVSKPASKSSSKSKEK